jgi:hypothetical protein
MLSQDLAQRMVQALPDGHYQEIALGHSMQYQDPTLIAKTLNVFHAEAWNG